MSDIRFTVDESRSDVRLLLAVIEAQNEHIGTMCEALHRLHQWKDFVLRKFPDEPAMRKSFERAEAVSDLPCFEVNSDSD